MIKGWVDADGSQHEKIYNVVWSAGRKIDSEGSLAMVGDTVDRTTGNYQNTIGASELATIWFDPDFDDQQHAFYYARVLQIPTARHSMYDAIALQTEQQNMGKSVIQERAYSSPIWYTP